MHNSIYSTWVSMNQKCKQKAYTKKNGQESL